MDATNRIFGIVDKMLRRLRRPPTTLATIAALRPELRSTNQRKLQSTLQPSTLDHGFRLRTAGLANPATSDAAFQRVLSWYLPPVVLEEVTPELEAFGEQAVSDQVHEWIANAEVQQPYVKKRDVWNNNYRFDRLVTSQGWKDIGRWGIANGYLHHLPLARATRHASDAPTQCRRSRIRRTIRIA